MLGLNIKVNINRFDLFLIKIGSVEDEDEIFNTVCFTCCFISSS
jgi:hypothetical protein